MRRTLRRVRSIAVAVLLTAPALNGLGFATSGHGAAAQAATVSPSAPGAPLELRTEQFSTRIRVTWAPPLSDGGSAIMGYEVVAIAPSGATAGTCTTDGSDIAAATGCFVTGLTDYTDYTVVVRAVNQAGATTSEPVTETPMTEYSTADQPAQNLLIFGDRRGGVIRLHSAAVGLLNLSVSRGRWTIAGLPGGSEGTLSVSVSDGAQLRLERIQSASTYLVLQNATLIARNSTIAGDTRPLRIVDNPGTPSTMTLVDSTVTSARTDGISVLGGVSPQITLIRSTVRSGVTTGPVLALSAQTRSSAAAALTTAAGGSSTATTCSNRTAVNTVDAGFNLADGSCSYTAPTSREKVGDTGLLPASIPLSSAGRPAQTARPGAGSPAIDAVAPGTTAVIGGRTYLLCPPSSNPSAITDQDGGPRLRGSGCDIGSLEQAPSLRLGTLPGPQRGTDYSHQVSIDDPSTAALGPIGLRLTSGSLPPGLTISGSTVAGTPTAVGTYRFTLAAYDELNATVPDSGHRVGARSYELTVVAPPSAPADLAATGEDSAITATWSAPADSGTSPVTGYRASAIGPDGGVAGTCATTALNCTLTGLTNATTYRVSVVATNIVGDGPPSSIVEATPGTAPQVTADPSDATVMDERATTFAVGVADNPASSATTWEQSTDGGRSWLPQKVGTAAGTTLTVIGAASRNNTLLRAVVTNPYGTATSVPARLTTVRLLRAPSAAATRDDGAVTLTWNTPTNAAATAPITGYTVDRVLASGLTTRICDTPADVRTCRVDGLTNGTRYTFRITGHNRGGEGRSATVNATPLLLARIVDQPDDVRTSAGRRITLTARISAADPQPSFRWQYSRDRGRSWANVTGSGATTPSLSFTALSARSGWQYRLRVNQPTAAPLLSRVAVVTLAP
ncbi:fibronectin type III domain-containing protein [Aeromicrobium sp.]|uniref:fibronectin type III domain-containing protein n=1 Tax=Aeromicrobium sp. TaxID=1871063 RepID=UPI00351672E5